MADIDHWRSDYSFNVSALNCSWKERPQNGRYTCWDMEMKGMWFSIKFRLCSAVKFSRPNVQGIVQSSWNFFSCFFNANSRLEGSFGVKMIHWFCPPNQQLWRIPIMDVIRHIICITVFCLLISEPNTNLRKDNIFWKPPLKPPIVSLLILIVPSGMKHVK